MDAMHFERNVRALAEQMPELGVDALREFGASVATAVASKPTLLGNVSVPDDADIVLLGSCYASEVPPLLNRSGRLALVEPDPSRLYELLANDDFSAEIRSGRLLVYPQRSAMDVIRAWRPPSSDRAMKRLVLLDAAANDSSRREFFARVAEGIRSRERDASLDTGAVIALGDIVVGNVVRNLARYRKPFPGSLWNEFKDVPAILVAAGPSLDKNLSAFRDVDERAVVIAVDTACKPLLAAGTKPHVAVAVDPRERNVHNLVDAALEETYLIAEVATHPALVATSVADRALVVADNAVGNALSALETGLPKVPMFGSVATAAFEVAVGMGCDPIVFIGQDLAFTGEREYSSRVDPRSMAGPSESEVRWEKDMHGEAVRTTLRLQSFRDWLTERMRALPERTYLNATGGGILKAPVRQIDASDMSDYLGPAVSVRHRLAAVFRERDRSARNDGSIERAGPEGLAPSLLRLRRETLSAMRALDVAESNPAAALRSYLEHRATVALVEILESETLLDLSTRWQGAPAASRNRKLFSALRQGCRRLLDHIGEACEAFRSR